MAFRFPGGLIRIESIGFGHSLLDFLHDRLHLCAHSLKDITGGAKGDVNSEQGAHDLTDAPSSAKMRRREISYGSVSSGAEAALSHFRRHRCTGSVAAGTLYLMVTDFCFDGLDLRDIKYLVSDRIAGFFGRIRIKVQRAFLALIRIAVIHVVHLLNRQKLAVLSLMALLCAGFASGGSRLFPGHFGSIRGRGL